MRKSCYSLVIVALLFAGSAVSAQQATITNLAMSPMTAEAGTTVTATVTGTAGICGAVEINWGDGDTVTYPTSQFPVVKTHVYKSTGRFDLRARGIANCSGETTARVNITAPPQPPPVPTPPPPPAAPARGEITGIEIPAAAILGEPVTIIVKGTGSCSIVLDFDDGQERRVSGQLPQRVTYRFKEVGAHEVMVWTDEPCTGSGEAVVRVRRR